MLQRLMQSIARMEGFYHPGTIPYRLNNPGDLIFRGQPFAKPRQVRGADGKIRTYAEFDTVEHGWQAMERQLRLYLKREPDMTILQAIQKWAPAEDANDPKGYAVFVAKALDKSLDSKLSEIVNG